MGLVLGKPILSFLVNNNEAFSYSPFFLLSLVYFAFVIPIGLIKKMMSTKNVTKGFIINEKEYKKEDLINPW